MPGRAERLRAGHDGTVFALGAMVEPALEAADRLQRDHDLYLEVWDARFCRPLDEEAIRAAAERTPWLATVEEHALHGGFGGAVAEYLAGAGLRPALQIHAVPDHFVPHMSSREEQLEDAGLDAVSLARAWAKSLRLRRPTATGGAEE